MKAERSSVDEPQRLEFDVSAPTLPATASTASVVGLNATVAASPSAASEIVAALAASKPIVVAEATIGGVSASATSAATTTASMVVEEAPVFAAMLTPRKTHTPSELSLATTSDIDEIGSVAGSEDEIALQVGVWLAAPGNRRRRFQLAFLNDVGGGIDDIFRSTVPVAEEAILADDTARRATREATQHLASVANVFELELRHINALVDLVGGGGGRSTR